MRTISDSMCENCHCQRSAVLLSAIHPNLRHWSPSCLAHTAHTIQLNLLGVLRRRHESNEWLKRRDSRPSTREQRSPRPIPLDMQYCNGLHPLVISEQSAASQSRRKLRSSAIFRDESTTGTPAPFPLGFMVCNSRSLPVMSSSRCGIYFCSSKIRTTKQNARKVVGNG